MNNSRKCSSYVPQIYSGFVEMEELISAEDVILDNAEIEKNNLQNNQFVLTANEYGIEQYENMLSIIPNPSTETLEFRRDRIINRLSMTPPFTFRFLKKKLDEIIGVGKWKAYIDFSNYTLYVESSANNQIWFEEIIITMSNLKPANIVFINQPLITQGLVLSEKISYSTMQYNYVLGVSWVLGAKPFLSYIDKGAIKLSNVSSLQSGLFNDVADFTASDIASVLINDSVTITAFVTKQASANIVDIEYNVLTSQVQAITNIKLKNSSGEVLSEAIVYVPLLEDVLMKHTITVKEEIK
ncbi:MAG: putative phage tail protein [Lachnospiraceae bacterium]